MTRCIPAARAIWARRQIASSTSLGSGHHQVCQLVDNDDDFRQGFKVLFFLGICQLIKSLEIPNAVVGKKACTGLTSH